MNQDTMMASALDLYYILPLPLAPSTILCLSSNHLQCPQGGSVRHYVFISKQMLQLNLLLAYIL